MKIALSDRMPVEIVEEDWPIISSHLHIKPIINDSAIYTVTVREHKSGRRLVYGSKSYLGITIQAGYLIPQGTFGTSTINAIHRVVDVLDGSFSLVALKCIESLPAEELT